MNALDISKCRLDAVSGARHLAFLVNGAGCSFVHGVFTVARMEWRVGAWSYAIQRGLGVRVCAGAYKSSPCPCGDQPVPPAGDRAVTPRLSEPPRMPKPSGCGRRCLISPGAAVQALRPHYCRLRWLVRRVELRAALHVRGSMRLALRVVFNRVALFDLGFGCTAAQGNEQCENRWPSCSHERTENQLRIPRSNIVSPKHRWSHRRAGRLRGVAWRGIERAKFVSSQRLPRPNFREDQGARDCYKYLILVATPAVMSQIKIF